MPKNPCGHLACPYQNCRERNNFDEAKCVKEFTALINCCVEKSKIDAKGNLVLRGVTCEGYYRDVKKIIDSQEKSSGK